MNQNEFQLRLATAQWWAAIGAAMFAAGIILLALAYSSQQVLPTVPQSDIGIFPLVSAQAFNIGAVITGIGVIVIVISKYKLAKAGLKSESSN